MVRIPGLRVGHATDAKLKSGVTVFLPAAPAIAAVHISGGGPATRETDLLMPGNSVEKVDAIVFSGGSAFGLAAADGVMRWLAAQGRGFQVGDARVPIVPAASLFDLANGGEKSAIFQPSGEPVYSVLGQAACEAAALEGAVGSVGAGTGATTAGLKGGFGAALAVFPDSGTLAAFVAANPVGRVTLGDTAHFRAAPFEVYGEFGDLGLPTSLPLDAATVVTKRSAQRRGATTLALVATDYSLTRDQAKRLAIAAHDGIALAIFPAHTPLDGDLVFALATGLGPPISDLAHLTGLCGVAAATLARAIARAVFAAEAAADDGLPTWQDRYGGGATGRAA